MSWLDNVEPRIKCWWMLTDYVESAIREFVLDSNKTLKGTGNTEPYTITFFLNNNTFYANHNLQTSFEYKLKTNGILDFIDISYGTNASDYAVKVHLKSNVTDEQIEYMIGLFALMGHTKTLNDTPF